MIDDLKREQVITVTYVNQKYQIYLCNVTKNRYIPLQKITSLDLLLQMPMEIKQFVKKPGIVFSIRYQTDKKLYQLRLKRQKSSGSYQPILKVKSYTMEDAWNLMRYAFLHLILEQNNQQRKILQKRK